MSHVAVTRVDYADLQRDYVALPREYGTAAWEERPDVRAIRRAVAANLRELEGRTGFSLNMAGKPVIIKPNLVSVWHKAGFLKPDYPNTTDPRVLEAVVLWLKQFTADITIAESSGRGMPTRGSFAIAGLDRLARQHSLRLVALEEEPVEAYYLPKAKVMKTILLPKIFGPVIRGEAFYISLPKLKTNMYTGVTLGFKNSMGCIPYDLRQQNHNYDLDQKLVDMLWLLRPHLTIIDGVVGAEGQCPGPVEPVDSRMIISGDNPVETDRVATGLMGFNPADIKLMALADQAGFGDSGVAVSGDLTPIPFRPADPSLLNSAFQKLFPHVRVLIGHSRGPQGVEVPQEYLSQMEQSCRGGCLATTRLGFEFLHHEGLDRNFPLTVVIGNGAQFRGERVWFSGLGEVYTTGAIAELPGNKLAVGNCSLKTLEQAVTHSISGCMVFPNSVHMKLHRLSNTRCRLVSPRAPQASILLNHTWRMRRKRMALLRRGIHLDLPGEELTIPAFKTDADYVPLALPPMSRRERRRRIRQEWREILDLLVY